LLKAGDLFIDEDGKAVEEKVEVVVQRHQEAGGSTWTGIPDGSFPRFPITSFG
jgi:hypothetical protein